jgi:hypothetical protein
MRHFDGLRGNYYHWREPAYVNGQISSLVGRIYPDKVIRFKTWLRIKERMR